MKLAISFFIYSGDYFRMSGTYCIFAVDLKTTKNKSIMKIRFSNPCDEEIIKTRVVPLKGTTRKRVDVDDKNWSWEFTQWDYYFIFECRNGKYSLSVTGGNPDDCYDYSSVEVSVLN